MREIKAIPITKENFAPYGSYYDFRGDDMREDKQRGWRAWMLEEKPLKGPIVIGITEGAPGNFECDSMERHTMRKELLLCGDGPSVLTVANSDPSGPPKEEDVAAFIMQPGDVVVLGYNTWHDANHSIDKKCYYYFMREAFKADEPKQPASEIEFVDVVPNPVKVIVK